MALGNGTESSDYFGDMNLTARLDLTADSAGEVKDAYDNVEKWAKTERAPFDMVASTMFPTVRKEPKGTVLVIVPFNMPMLLVIQPLVRILRILALSSWLTTLGVDRSGQLQLETRSS